MTIFQETPRLLIRRWQDSDRIPFAAINADPEVRKYYYPSVLAPNESDAFIEAAQRAFDVEGFGFLAVERKSDRALIGGAGLSRPGKEVPGEYPVEIGWILGRPYWREGYATEMSLAWFDLAWSELGIDEVIGYTSAINTPSRRLMERIGMTHLPDADFEDSTVPVGNVLRPHVLYRIARP